MMLKKVSICAMKLHNGIYYISILEPGKTERIYLENDVTFNSRDWRVIKNKIAQLRKELCTN